MTATIDEAGRRYGAGDLPEAARICLDIVSANPADAGALHLLGVICTLLGYRADGVSYLLRAAALLPGDPRLPINLGNALGAMQRFDEALSYYLIAQRIDDADADLLNNTGLALRGLNRLEDGIGSFRAALRRDPEHAPARFNLARGLRDQGNLLEAETEFLALRASLPLADPQADPLADPLAGRSASVASELALTYMEAEQPDRAIAVLRASGQAAPWNEAFAQLIAGHLDEGWRAYESRWTAPGHGAAPPGHTVLDPDLIAGRRVLIKEEQGRGDNIQFLRYARLLARRGARVLVSTYPDLAALAREMPDVEAVFAPGDTDYEYDQITSIMSLPLAFRTSLATIPADVPYLRAPASRISRMRWHLGPARGRRVGVVWSGSAHSQARAAMPARILEPLLRRDGLEFHCLQKDIAEEDRAWAIATGLVVPHDSILADFADTAALIEAMDLVVSVDTAVAHLAGALAKPVWIMLPRNPDWRWLLNRDDSPWYPTARLFRQPSRGDWAGVVQAIADAVC